MYTADINNPYKYSPCIAASVKDAIAESEKAGAGPFRADDWLYEVELYDNIAGHAFGKVEETGNTWLFCADTGQLSYTIAGLDETLVLSKHGGVYYVAHYIGAGDIVDAYSLKGVCPQAEWAARRAVEAITADMYNHLLTGGQA